MDDAGRAFLAVVRVGYPALTLGAFLFLFVWEGGAARVPQSQRARHVGRNLALFVLMVAFADGVVGGGLLRAGRAWFDAPQGLLTPLHWPLAVQVAVGVVAADLLSYGIHRLSHRWRWLWRVHAVHHSDGLLDVTTGLRFHPLDMACYVALIIAMLAALGLPWWVEGIRALILNPLTLAQHANVRWPARGGPIAAWLFVTPALHRYHHAADAPGIDANFGQVLSVWDRLFGTYAPPPPDGPARVGVPALAAEPWQTVAGMLATPFTGGARLR